MPVDNSNMKTTFCLLFVVLFCACVSAENLSELFYRAHVAYKKHQYSQCAQQYVDLINKGSKDPDALYNAAGCFALGGQPDLAFEYLSRMCKSDFVDIQGFIDEPDFQSLHRDSRWPGAVDKCRQAEKNHVSHGNARLYELYIAMVHSQEHWIARDADEVLKLVSTRKLKSAEDFFYAAAVITGSTDPQQLTLAHSLAKKAVALSPDFVQAKALTAAAYDRFLWASNRPQIYGTQLKQEKNGKWTAEPFDPKGVSDDERTAACVLSLAGIEERLKMFNQGIR